MNQKKHLPEIEVFIASCYDVFTSLHGFHWNVEGDNFFDLHEFFKQSYEFFHEQIDAFAERLRVFDVYAPSTLAEMKLLSSIKIHKDRKLSGKKMLEIFCANASILVDQAKHLIKLCEEVDDLATQDMLIDFVNEQEKRLWIAKSYMKK